MTSAFAESVEHLTYENLLVSAGGFAQHAG
jgi:hypothetical protein